VAVTEPLPGFVAARKIHISPEVTVDPVGAGGTIFVGGGAMEFGTFAGATRILGRMPAGVALVALGIGPPQSLVITGRGIVAATTARPNAGPGRRRPWLPRSRGRPTGPGSTTRASQIRRDDLGGRRIREKTWGGEPVGRVRTAQRAAEPFVATEVSPVPPEPSTLQLFRTRAAHRAGTRQSPNSTAAERPAVDQI
jgi:hypothetical protein